MRQIALATAAACLLGSTSALAADTSIEIGVHAGVFVFDQLDQATTSWYATPRLSFWFTHNLGLELDAGVSTGDAARDPFSFLAVTPQVNFIGNPISASKNAPVWPIVTLGGGLMYKRISLGDNPAPNGIDVYSHERMEGMVSVGTGLIIPIIGPLHARTDARMVITGAANDDIYKTGPLLHFQWTAGLSARFDLAKDTDKDKVPDKNDLCVNDPEDADGFEDSDGCPDTDNDVDGIPDAVDQCPNEAEDVDTFEDADGCPDPDNDGDGILDGVDTCPLEAGTERTYGCPDTDGDLIADKDDACPQRAGLPEFQGCPDTDGDGLPDPNDECPNEVGPASSFGCPDNDIDRVPNYRDACPDKAVPDYVDPLRSDGCPARVYVTLDAIRITETVYFATGSDVIRSTSFGLLDDIAAVFQAYPEIKKVRVEGHTDDRGDDAANMTLSQKRAESVVRYLVEKGGIAADRLVAQGFGETRPIADNKTSSGRAENRRVAFTIVEQVARVVEKSEVPLQEQVMESVEEELEESSDTPAAE